MLRKSNREKGVKKQFCVLVLFITEARENRIRTGNFSHDEKVP